MPPCSLFSMPLHFLFTIISRWFSFNTNTHYSVSRDIELSAFSLVFTRRSIRFVFFLLLFFLSFFLLLFPLLFLCSHGESVQGRRLRGSPVRTNATYSGYRSCHDQPMQSSFPWTMQSTDSLTQWWDKTTYKASTLDHSEVLYTLSYSLPTFNLTV